MEGILAFLEEAGRLKRVERAGWKKRGVEGPESVAEHTYRTALLAMLLADIEKADTLRAIRMALLHDLPEARTGDLLPGTPGKKEAEGKAMRGLLSSLPKGLSEEYRRLWEEYSAGKGKEARIVKEADRLEMLLQALEYEREGYDVKDFWAEDYRFEAGEGVYKALKKRRRG